jgi:hypothetical protein
LKWLAKSGKGTTLAVPSCSGFLSGLQPQGNASRNYYGPSAQRWTVGDRKNK